MKINPLLGLLQLNEMLEKTNFSAEDTQCKAFDSPQYKASMVKSRLEILFKSLRIHDTEFR